MYFNDYMHEAAKTADYDDPFYPIASVVVEAAELSDLFVKPMLRGDDQYPTDEEVLSEAGDVLWNLAMILRDQGLTLDDAAQYNLKKLADRHERGVIRGNGGNR